MCLYDRDLGNDPSFQEEIEVHGGESSFPTVHSVPMANEYGVHDLRFHCPLPLLSMWMGMWVRIKVLKIG